MFLLQTQGRVCCSGLQRENTLSRFRNGMESVWLLSTLTNLGKLWRELRQLRLMKSAVELYQKCRLLVVNAPLLANGAVRTFFPRLPSRFSLVGCGAPAGRFDALPEAIRPAHVHAEGVVRHVHRGDGRHPLKRRLRDLRTTNPSSSQLLTEPDTRTQYTALQHAYKMSHEGRLS